MLMKNWKNTLKAKRNSKYFFSLLPWTAQTAQREGFMFQNVAYIWTQLATVYKTGVPVKGRKMIISSSEKPNEGYFHMHWIIKFVDQSLKRFPRPSRQIHNW